MAIEVAKGFNLIPDLAERTKSLVASVRGHAQGRDHHAQGGEVGLVASPTPTHQSKAALSLPSSIKSLPTMTQLKTIAAVVGSASVAEQDVTAAAATTTITTAASAIETSKLLTEDKQFAEVDAKSAEKSADKKEAVSIEADKNIAKVDAHSDDKSGDESEAVSIEADDNDGQAIGEDTPVSESDNLGSAAGMFGAGMGSVMGGVGSVGSASFSMMPGVEVPDMGLGDVNWGFSFGRPAGTSM